LFAAPTATPFTSSTPPDVCAVAAIDVGAALNVRHDRNRERRLIADPIPTELRAVRERDRRRARPG
jgi:hypothetical protein